MSGETDPPGSPPAAVGGAEPEEQRTFLLTDIEGSTPLWKKDPESMERAIERHDEIIRASVEAHGGRIVKSRGEGDSLFAIFDDPADAISASLEAQKQLGAEDWPASLPIQVRMAIHSGEVALRDGDYYGNTVNRAARLRAVGHGGQVLVSRSSSALVGGALPGGAELEDLGPHPLRDFREPESIYQLKHVDLRSAFPPLKSPDWERVEGAYQARRTRRAVLVGVLNPSLLIALPYAVLAYLLYVRRGQCCSDAAPEIRALGMVFVMAGPALNALLTIGVLDFTYALDWGLHRRLLRPQDPFDPVRFVLWAAASQFGIATLKAAGVAILLLSVGRSVNFLALLLAYLVCLIGLAGVGMIAVRVTAARLPYWNPVLLIWCAAATAVTELWPVLSYYVPGFDRLASFLPATPLLTAVGYALTGSSLLDRRLLTGLGEWTAICALTLAIGLAMFRRALRVQLPRQVRTPTAA